jgi:DNA helicase II / ATP-dependent DNA helicase PcrA
LSTGPRFFLVGDPAQSVFGFTGARPELIDPFAKEIAARADLSLSSDFRSSPPIVQQANRLFPRQPQMTSEGEAKACAQPAVYHHVDSTFDALIEEFLPLVADLNIPLGRAAVLARNWTLLYPLARKLREFEIPVVGPGARPYRRSRLFATLAEQLCGAVMDREAYSIRQLERAVFHAVQDITGHQRAGIFSFAGRLVVVRLLREAEALAKVHGAAAWLDEMSERTGRLTAASGWIDQGQSGLFRASVEDMKADMRERKEDIPNLSIEDLGMFASPHRAMRLLTVHNAKGHEYGAVALIGARERPLPDYRSMDTAGIAAEKRLFYVGVTRAERLLMYICERDKWGNPPSRFLGAGGVNVI